MITVHPRSSLLLIAVLSVFFACPIANPAGGDQGRLQQERPTVVQVEKTARGIAYIVDSKRTGSTATTDLLYVLNQVRYKHGSSVPIVVLLDPGVPIDQVWNVDGTAGKAQLNNLRYFVVFRETKTMVEITRGPAMPYSTDPPINPDPLGIR